MDVVVVTLLPPLRGRCGAGPVSPEILPPWTSVLGARTIRARWRTRRAVCLRGPPAGRLQLRACQVAPAAPVRGAPFLL